MSYNRDARIRSLRRNQLKAIFAAVTNHELVLLRYFCECMV
jgi:hypothetical protein